MPNNNQNGSQNRTQQTHQVQEVEFWANKEETIPKEDLFSTQASRWSDAFNSSGLSKNNKRTQLRGFYDEVINFKMKLLIKKEDFQNLLPYIKMLNAKLTYAQARGNITTDCQKSFIGAINKIKNYNDFMLFASFFEAFMAFYKQHSK